MATAGSPSPSLELPKPVYGRMDTVDGKTVFRRCKRFRCDDCNIERTYPGTCQQCKIRRRSQAPPRLCGECGEVNPYARAELCKLCRALRRPGSKESKAKENRERWLAEAAKADTQVPEAPTPFIQMLLKASTPLFTFGPPMTEEVREVYLGSGIKARMTRGGNPTGAVVCFTGPREVPVYITNMATDECVSPDDGACFFFTLSYGCNYTVTVDGTPRLSIRGVRGCAFEVTYIRVSAPVL